MRGAGFTERVTHLRDNESRRRRQAVRGPILDRAQPVCRPHVGAEVAEPPPTLVAEDTYLVDVEDAEPPVSIR